METLTHRMSRWSTEELLGEVVRRTAADAPALRLAEGVILRARLAASDRGFAEIETPAEPGPAIDRAGVRGTMELGLADGHD